MYNELLYIMIIVYNDCMYNELLCIMIIVIIVYNNYIGFTLIYIGFIKDYVDNMVNQSKMTIFTE